MKYIILILFIPMLAIIWLADRDYQSQYQTIQDNLQTQIEMTDSLQSLVDICDARVNDMRYQRDHCIETVRWHEARWNEMKRMRPE